MTPTPTAERLLAELRTEIARADTKASFLVAALGITGGFGGLLSGGPGARLGPAADALRWAGATALTLALLSLVLAVLPRGSRTGWVPGTPLSYYGDIRRAVRSDGLREALATTDLDPTAAVLTALTEASRIAERKHQWIRAGLFAYGTGAVLFLGAPLLG